MKRFFSLLLAAALALSLPPRAAAQLKAAPPAGMYGSVAPAWAASFQTIAAQPTLLSASLTQALPNLNLDLSNPASRAALAPVVAHLQAQGLTPETVSAADVKAAVASAKSAVTAEAQTLITQVAAAEPGHEDLPGMTAKLNMLRGPLGVYLPAEMRPRIKRAYKQAHAKLSDAQRTKVNALLKNIADGLTAMTPVEAMTADGSGAVRAGEADPDSFARRHAQLSKPEPRAPEITPRQQAILDLTAKSAPIFDAWVAAPTPEARQMAAEDFFAIRKELGGLKSDEGRDRKLLKKQGIESQNETVQSALKRWSLEEWLISQAGGSEWPRLLEWPMEPALKKKTVMRLAQPTGSNPERAEAIWNLVENFAPHAPTDETLRRNVAQLTVRVKAALDAWLRASAPDERPKAQAELKALNAELDRSEHEELERKAILEGRSYDRDPESPAHKTEMERIARNDLVEWTDHPDSEFNRLLDLPMGTSQRADAVRSYAKHEHFSVEAANALAALVRGFKNSGPSNASASIEELYQSDRWRLRLSSTRGDTSYPYNFEVMLPNGVIAKHYAQQAAQARERGEMIVTGGRQTTRPQSRGTCPYNAACNLFAEPIAESRMTSKDILREAYRLNPTFAARPRGATQEINGLPYEKILAMTRALAARIGMQVAQVKSEDLVKFMAEKKTPVMVTINSWDKVRRGPFNHEVVVGNPFVLQGYQGERSVAFEVYDSNLPAGAVSYIDADTLDGAMRENGLALVAKK